MPPQLLKSAVAATAQRAYKKFCFIGMKKFTALYRAKLRIN
mgnify:CR=1 FL=1